MSDPRRARVAAVIRAARRIADPQDPLGAKALHGLPASTGLSPEGVALALSAHLETHPSDDDLEALVASAGSAPRCHLVLAANVFCAAHRALACGVATSPEVLVKASRRDPLMTTLLLEALAADPRFKGRVTLTSELAAIAGEEVHLYASDESIEAICATLEAGVLVRAHGHGVGLALLEDGRNASAQAARVAADLLAFDGRGCLSPRLIIVARHGQSFFEALSDAMTRAGEKVPRGQLNESDASALAQFKRLMEAVGSAVAGPNHLLAFDEAPQALTLPAPPRSALVVEANASTALGLIECIAPHVAAIGSADATGCLTDAIRQRCPRARLSELGSMQRPPLDGPVDLRTVPRLIR